jgi:hypothetical protein
MTFKSDPSSIEGVSVVRQARASSRLGYREHSTRCCFSIHVAATFIW